MCTNCGAINKPPEDNRVNHSTSASVDETHTFGQQGMFSQTQSQSPPTQPTKQSPVQFSAEKPPFVTPRELQELGLAYFFIVVGFAARRFILAGDLLMSILEASILVLGIFGVWYLLDKAISYRFRLFSVFRFEPSRVPLAVLFSFIFVGFPPGYYRYVIWVKNPPVAKNILAIQFFSYAFLTTYGFMVWALVMVHPPLATTILAIFPLVISLSVGVGLLPLPRTPGRVLAKWNLRLYVLLAVAVAALLALGWTLSFGSPL